MEDNSVVSQLTSPAVNTLIVGMSGIGKSWLARQLVANGRWRRISIDTEIQSRYLREEILTRFHEEVATCPMISRLQALDAVTLDLDHHQETLAPLTAWLGMPGDRRFGGITFDEYQRRQDAHFAAERCALEDLLNTSDDGPPLLVDTGGSFCEVVSIDEPLFKDLQQKFRIVSLRESDALVSRLIDRFSAHPKPIYFPRDLLAKYWQLFLQTGDLGGHEVMPNEFALFAYEQLIALRRDKYTAIADQSELCIDAEHLLSGLDPDMPGKLRTTETGKSTRVQDLDLTSDRF